MRQPADKEEERGARLPGLPQHRTLRRQDNAYRMCGARGQTLNGRFSPIPRTRLQRDRRRRRADPRKRDEEEHGAQSPLSRLLQNRPSRGRGDRRRHYPVVEGDAVAAEGEPDYGCGAQRPLPQHRQERVAPGAGHLRQQHYWRSPGDQLSLRGAAHVHLDPGGQLRAQRHRERRGNNNHGHPHRLPKYQAVQALRPRSHFRSIQGSVQGRQDGKEGQGQKGQEEKVALCVPRCVAS
mmetsp:Transcript_40937/g.97007  ORF Transcript_40937/g.97007 Transcript_40937/m.97007 type:complete len:237 (+) Transcript_40937:410-1120(+)